MTRQGIKSNRLESRIILGLSTIAIFAMVFGCNSINPSSSPFSTSPSSPPSSPSSSPSSSLSTSKDAESKAVRLVLVAAECQPSFKADPTISTEGTAVIYRGDCATGSGDEIHVEISRYPDAAESRTALNDTICFQPIIISKGEFTDSPFIVFFYGHPASSYTRPPTADNPQYLDGFCWQADRWLFRTEFVSRSELPPGYHAAEIAIEQYQAALDSGLLELPSDIELAVLQDVITRLSVRADRGFNPFNETESPVWEEGSAKIFGYPAFGPQGHFMSIQISRFSGEQEAANKFLEERQGAPAFEFHGYPAYAWQHEDSPGAGLFITTVYSWHAGRWLITVSSSEDTFDWSIDTLAEVSEEIYQSAVSLHMLP